MAQLGVQYPGATGLPDIFQGQITGQRMNTAQQNEGINQHQALQDMFQQEQQFPLQQRQRELANQTTEAQLPGVQADSWQKGRNQQVRQGIPLDVEQRAQLSKLAKEMTEDDYKATEAALSNAMISGDRRAMEHASQMIPYWKEVQIERMKLSDRGQREADATALALRGQKDLEQMRIDAGKYKSKTGGAKSTESTIAGAKTARERHQALIDAATVAQQEGNEALAESYAARAAAIRPQAEAEIATPKPGAVDPRSVMPNLQVQPSPQIAPPGNKPQIAPSGATGDTAIFTKAFGNYEPNVYEYRIGPNGVPQRRKK
jgi:hypothetical protein